jgi:hypothetical protein
LWTVDPRKENGGIVRSAQELLQAKSIVDDLTFALNPEIAHGAPLTASSCEPADEDNSVKVARNRRKSTAASKAG